MSAPLCKDCKWCKPHNPIMGRLMWGRRVWEFAQCTNTTAAKPNLASGLQEKNYAEHIREYNRECGPEGKLWEAA